jgi:hypothetical protein
MRKRGPVNLNAHQGANGNGLVGWIALTEDVKHHSLPEVSKDCMGRSTVGDMTWYAKNAALVRV